MHAPFQGEETEWGGGHSRTWDKDAGVLDGLNETVDVRMLEDRIPNLLIHS